MKWILRFLGFIYVVRMNICRDMLIDLSYRLLCSSVHILSVHHYSDVVLGALVLTMMYVSYKYCVRTILCPQTLKMFFFVETNLRRSDWPVVDVLSYPRAVHKGAKKVDPVHNGIVYTPYRAFQKAKILLHSSFIWFSPPPLPLHLYNLPPHPPQPSQQPRS